MKNIRFMRVGWVFLLIALVLGVSFITPTLASTNAARHAKSQAAASTSVDAIVYLTMSTLQPRFQQSLDQQVPGTVANAINAMVNNMPAIDRSWARTMAVTIIQPSATLQSLVPQQNGMAMTISVALYPGDPKPISASLLISFSVLDSTTVQVSAGPLNNGPALANGPQSTFQIPFGTLSGVNTTPGCGDSALALHQKFPVALGQIASTQTQTQTAHASLTGQGNPMAVTANRKTRDNSNSSNTFIEIPASSLSAISGSIGNMPIGSNFTAQNIRISVQGNAIHILSDVYWAGLNIGSADTTVAPGAGGGNLKLSVTNTSFSLFGLFNFPMNSYNQQIEQTLDSKLGNAFAGMFSVSSAAIGSNSHLPCAKSNSLVLTGTSTIG